MPIWIIIVLAILFICFLAVVFGGLCVLIKSFFRDESKDPQYLEHYTTDGRPREEVFPTAPKQ